MYVYIISYGIYSFIFNKIFILFPEESSILLNLPMDKIIKSIPLFNLGIVIGKCFSIFNFNHHKSIIISLSTIVFINSLIICNFFLSFNILIFRFILGISIGFIITIFMKEISFRYKEYKQNEKFYSFLLNYHIISIPLWILFKYIIPINKWLLFVNIILIGNIIYIQLSKENFQYKSEKFLIEFPENFISKYLYKYILLGIILSLILFIAMLVLLIQHKVLEIYEKDYIYMYLETFTNKNIKIFYNQIPLLMGSLCFFMRNKLKPYIIYIIFFLMFINFFFHSLTLFSIVNGLMYGMYIIFAPFFTSYVKYFTSHFKQSQLFFYGLKSLLSFILQSLFLSTAFNFVIKHEYNYLVVVFSTYVFIKILLIIFEKIKVSIAND
jgi:hypothetical protein